MNNSTVFSQIIILFVLILFSLSNPLFSQKQSVTDIGFEFQAYPTGLIPGFDVEIGFSQKNAIHLRIGINWIRHRDLGVHEDERGNGFGFSFGYKRYFKENFRGIFLEPRLDLWFNSLDWKDNIDGPGEISGSTDITVLQPTLVAGIALEKNGWVLSPTLAFGFEKNIKTEGQDVGDGAILLIGFSINRRF